MEEKKYKEDKKLTRDRPFKNGGKYVKIMPPPPFLGGGKLQDLPTSAISTVRPCLFCRHTLCFRLILLPTSTKTIIQQDSAGFS